METMQVGKAFRDRCSHLASATVYSCTIELALWYLESQKVQL